MQHRLIWFRDDLRVNDNAALSAALDCQCDVAISAVFLSADSDWKDFHYGRNRLYYTEQLLRNLSEQLAALGIVLEVVRLESYQAQVTWVAGYCESRSVTDLFLNQEYQWNERIRDHQIVERLPDVTVHTYVDRVLMQPGTVLTGDNRYYSVFSPFKRRWLSIYQEHATGVFDFAGQSRESIRPSAWDPICDQPDSDLSLFPTTESDARALLDEFVTQRLTNYEANRNNPSVLGTSRLSGALARGLLSPRQCVQAAEVTLNRPITEFPSHAFSWINELIWRDFYQHLLVGFPDLSKNKAFRPETERLRWRNNPLDIEAWKNGRTGIPIVDAGMRELATTGWMHNRVRMIVAQFLTKNLLCDWRIGEAHFMKYLVDSDLGSNNGGWQWSASTGTDAAPYFRVFNPVSQGETHDPDAEYVTRFIPELASVPIKKRHSPWSATLPDQYPAPIVDLKSSRQRAIDAFKELKS